MEGKKKKSGVLTFFTIIACLLMIIMGFVLFFIPARGIVWFFSAAVFVRGIQMIAKYFVDKENRNGWNIIGGIINIIFGSFMLFGGLEDRAIGVITIGIFVAIWAMFEGVSRFIDSFGEKKAGGKGWIWSLISGILIVLFGISLMVWPLMVGALALEVLGYFAAAAFVIMGLSGIAGALSSGGNNSGSDDGNTPKAA